MRGYTLALFTILVSLIPLGAAAEDTAAGDAGATAPSADAAPGVDTAPAAAAAGGMKHGGMPCGKHGKQAGAGHHGAGKMHGGKHGGKHGGAGQHGQGKMHGGKHAGAGHHGQGKMHGGRHGDFHREMISRMDLMEARLAKMEAMLETLLRR